MPTLNNIRKHINSDLKAACTHSVHSHKITITSPSITVVTLTNIQIQMTHPFLHSGPQISCSQRGNSLQQHTHSCSNLWCFRTLLLFYAERRLSPLYSSSSGSFLTFSFSPLTPLFLPDALPHQQETPQDAECEWGRNDRTMGSKLSPNPQSTHS